MPQWNSQKFAHTSPRLHMSSAKHTADIEKIIQLIPDFVQHAPSDVRHGNCDLLLQFWQRLWKRWDKHSSLDFFDYLMYKWSMFQKLAPSPVTWSNGRDWFSKESTRVGAFPDPHHLRTKQGPSSKMLCFFCTLDGGESSKQKYAWMSQTIIKSSQNWTVYFMCPHNKWSCLAISGHLNHMSFVPAQPIHHWWLFDFM